MSEVNAAPSNTEPSDNHQWTVEERAAIQGAGVAPLQINQLAEAGPATAGETTGIPAIPLATGNAATDAAAPSTSMMAAQASADAAASTTAIQTGDAPAVVQPDPTNATASNAAVASGELSSALISSDASAAGNGTGAASAATATSTLNAADSGDAGIAAADLGNAGASLAAGQSASGTASSALVASQGDDIAADALLAELEVLRDRITDLEQQLVDARANVAKWQTAYNEATTVRQPSEPPAAHRWISLLEMKLSDLEYDARNELLDVARQLREAL